MRKCGDVYSNHGRGVRANSTIGLVPGFSIGTFANEHNPDFGRNVWICIFTY